MNLLVDNINEFVDFLEDYQITADQFLFCVLLSAEQDSDKYDLPDRQKSIANFFRYHENVVENAEYHVWTQPSLQDLVDKGFISRIIDDPENFDYQNFETTEKFIDLVFEEKNDLKEQYLEFWDEYPARYESDDGTMFNIKAVNKEEMFEVYKNALNDVEHDTLMDCLKLAKQKDEVNCRLDKWLKSHQWEPYVDEIEKGVTEESVSQTLL